MTVEEKVITKVRKTILTDSTICGYIGTRVYPSHISTIDKPIYPALSIHLLPSKVKFAEVGYVDVVLQLDTWLPMSRFSTSDVLAVQDRLRALFQRQRINDTAIGCFGFGAEEDVGAIMVEDDTKLLHLPTIYKFTACSR